MNNNKITEDGEGAGDGGGIDATDGMSTDIITGGKEHDPSVDGVLGPHNFEIPVFLGGVARRFLFEYPKKKKNNNGKPKK